MFDFILILIAVFGGAAIGAVAASAIANEKLDYMEGVNRQRVRRLRKQMNDLAALDTNIMNNLRSKLDFERDLIADLQARLATAEDIVAVNKVQSLQTHPKLYVIAPNAEAGIRWARNNESPRGIVRTTIVTEPEQLRGVTEGQYVIVPGFWLNEEWQTQLAFCNRQDSFLRYTP